MPMRTSATCRPKAKAKRSRPAPTQLFREWIEQGAKAPDEPIPPDPRQHWAFVPPIRSLLPKSRIRRGAKNPIDRLLAAGHDKHGLTPEPPAETICPAAPGLSRPDRPAADAATSCDAFLADTSPDAYEKVVDRLLASPRYGERWGRHWMDVWRYSDWSGEGENQVRDSQKHIWRWRDWIVESLNEDKGYDRMVLEMLAGDELAPDDPNVLRATGFLARNYYQVQPQRLARRHGRAHRQGVPRPDVQLRQVPRPQVRSRSRRRTTTACGRSSSRTRSAPMPCRRRRTC